MDKRPSKIHFSDRASEIKSSGCKHPVNHCYKEMNAISMAATFRAELQPSELPPAAASQDIDVSAREVAIEPSAVAESWVSGSMIFAITSAAGALATLAARRCPDRFRILHTRRERPRPQ